MFKHIANAMADCSSNIMGSDQVMMVLPSALMSSSTEIETFRRIIQRSPLDPNTKSEFDHRFLLFLSDLEVTADWKLSTGLRRVNLRRIPSRKKPKWVWNAAHGKLVRKSSGGIDF